MRLLPRTTRGTLTLAAAAWLAGAALLWWLLPVVPRAAWRASRPSLPAGLSSGGRVLVTRLLSTSLAPDDDRLYDPGPLTVWDGVTGRPVATWGREDQEFGLIAVSPDGRWVAFEDGSPSLRLLDLTDRTTRDLPGAEAGRRWAFTPDGRYLVYHAFHDWRLGLRLWDLTARVVRADLVGSFEPFRLSSNGRWLACEHAPGRPDAPDHSVAVWDLDRPAVPRTTAVSDGRGPHDLAIAPDGRRLAALTSSDGRRVGDARCWDVADGRELLCVRQVSAMAWADDGTTLVTVHATGNNGERLRFWDTGTGRLRRELDLDPGERCDILLDGPLSPDGRTLAAVAERPTLAQRFASCADRLGLPWPFEPGQSIPVVRLRNAVTGRPCGEVTGRPWIDGWSPDGGTLATDGGNGLIQLWDVPPGKPLGLWLALSAALAVPIVGLTAWRVRRRKCRQTDSQGGLAF